MIDVYLVDDTLTTIAAAYDHVVDDIANPHITQADVDISQLGKRIIH